jgi:hypothetical protein
MHANHYLAVFSYLLGTFRKAGWIRPVGMLFYKCYLGYEVYFKINLLLIHIVVNQKTSCLSYFLVMVCSRRIVGIQHKAPKFGFVVLQVLTNKMIVLSNTKEKNNLVVTVIISSKLMLNLFLQVCGRTAQGPR